MCWLFLVGCFICPILDWEFFLIASRMYLQDRFHSIVFIGRFNIFFVSRLLVDFVLFAWSPGSWSRGLRVSYWFGVLPVELGLSRLFVELVSVFRIGLSLSPSNCMIV